MSTYQDDPNDPNYIIFNSNGVLLGLREACDEIKQKWENNISSGGICYILSEIIALGPILDKYIKINELPSKNGIRVFEVENKAKSNKRIIELRIGKKPGFPKSKKSIDIQILLEYLKQEIKEVNTDLINKLKDAKNNNTEIDFENLSSKEKIILKKILFELSNEFPEYKKFQSKDEKNKIIINNEDIQFLKELLLDEKNFDYIVDNIPGFIMSSGGCARNVSTILTGRPSKTLLFKDYENKKEELEKILEKLLHENLNELNSITLSNGSHAFAIKEIITIDNKLMLYLRNPWGSGDKADIISDESDKQLKNTEYKNFNSNYEKTGLALLTIDDIQKTFKRIDKLDFEMGKYMYKQEIKKEDMENKKYKNFDFVIDINNNSDNIKIDVSNFNTDLKRVNNDTSQIYNFKIYDKDNTLIKEIKRNDLEEISLSDKNVLSNLKKGKYLLRAYVLKPCTINIIRNFGCNKVKYLGEENDNNINILNEDINYSDEDNEKNNFVFEKEINDTVKIMRFMEKIHGVDCIRSFKKISESQIILYSNSIIKDKLILKVVNDIKNHFIKGTNEKNGKEIIRIENNKIFLFNTDVTSKFCDKFYAQEMLIDENKIAIVDDKGNYDYKTIEELKNYKGKIKKFMVKSFAFSKNKIKSKNNEINPDEIISNNYSFENLEDAIKKMQEISKNLAGITKDFSTGGVEFEQPKAFKNFIENFYCFKEHIIAFKCEKNAVKEIKDVLNKILNKDIQINSLQEVWETILDELIHGYLIGDCLPFISLHFNDDSLLYSVMNTNYKYSITGHVLTFIDYFLKGFVNGAYFKEDFVYNWYENYSVNFNNSNEEAESSLSCHVQNIFEYVYKNKIDMQYCTIGGLVEDMLLNGDEQYYLSTNRIIGKMSDDKILKFDENILYPEFNFQVEGDLDPLPSLINLLNKSPENSYKWDLTKKAHEAMKIFIKNNMNKLPFLKGYFYLLDMITFAIYYLCSIKSLSALPDISKSIRQKYIQIGKNYMKVIPSVYPPLPTTKYYEKEFITDNADYLNKFNHNLKNKINDNIVNILKNNLESKFDSNLEEEIKIENENILDELLFNKYGQELSFKNKSQMKFSVIRINIIYDILFSLWISVIDFYKDSILQIKQKFLRLGHQSDVDINTLNSLEAMIYIKNTSKDIKSKEEKKYVELVFEKLIKPKICKNYNFTILEIEKLARERNMIDLINQIAKYKNILEIEFLANNMVETFEEKKFNDEKIFEFKKKIKFASVGYNNNGSGTGKASYRGGCLVNFREQIELKQEHDNKKLNLIKNGLYKEEIEIEENNNKLYYFTVKTNINNILYDKQSLIEINKSINLNLRTILKSIYQNMKISKTLSDNGLRQIYFKILSNNEKIYDTININDLTRINESKENILIYLPSLKQSNLLNEFLLKQNFNILRNIKPGNNKITPLLSAISAKNKELSKIFIEKGFDINNSTDIKYTPLHLAVYYGLTPVIKLLINHLADAGIKTKKEGEIPLHIACKKGFFEIAEILLKNKSFINETKLDGKTPLHLAAMNSTLTTQVLLKNGANIFAKDNNGLIPSDLSLIYGKEDIFNFIIKKNNKLENLIEKYYKYDNDKWNLDWKKNYSIQNLCNFMKKNDIDNALKISKMLLENEGKCDDENLIKKLIKNACKGNSIEFLNILMNLFDIKKYKNTLFLYIYKNNLKSWKEESEKNKINFDKKINEENFEILEYLLLNKKEEFVNLMNYIKEIPNQFLSKILLDKILNKIEIENFITIFCKFNPYSINISEFSKNEKTSVDDMIYLLKQKYTFNIDFKSFNLENMMRYCNPEVVSLILNTNEFNINNKTYEKLKKISFNDRKDNYLILINNNKNKIFNININNLYNKKHEILEEDEPENFNMDEKDIDKLINDYISNQNIEESKKIFKLGLYPFKEGNIFDIINKYKKYSDLDKLKFQNSKLLNSDIMFRYIKEKVEISEIEIDMDNLLHNYLLFINKHFYNKDWNTFNIFVDLIDILIEKSKIKIKYKELFKQLIISIENLLIKFKYLGNLYNLINAKSKKNENILHILTRYEIFFDEELEKHFLNILDSLDQISKNSLPKNKNFKNLFNHKNKNAKTFIMNLIDFDAHKLFCNIYLKYKNYINPFIYDDFQQNIFHYIISLIKDDSTKNSCLDKYLLIINYILLNNPNIIFSKNHLGYTPLLMYFDNESYITGIINLILKFFSFEILEKKLNKSILEIIISKNNIPLLRYLIENHHININNKLYNSKFFPLHLAAIYSKIDLFEFLIQYGANPFLKDDRNLDSINYAMAHGNKSFLEYLFNMKISDLFFSKKYLFNLLENKEGLNIFKNAIKSKNIDINMVNSFNQTLLIAACARDNFEFINYLINCGINPLLTDKDKNTALHICCINNSINSINILLQKLFYKSKLLLKSNLLLFNNEDDTPLHIGAKYGHIEIVEKLLAYHFILMDSEKIRIKSKGEYLPVHYSIINNKIDVALFLIKSLNISDEEINDIIKDIFYTKIKNFIENKNKYIQNYKVKTEKYIEKLNNDIEELEINYDSNVNLYLLNELNDSYEFNYIKKISINNFMNDININGFSSINEDYKNNIFKYFHIFNKQKFLNKVINLIKSRNIHLFYKFLDILDKSDWNVYPKLYNLVELFITNILPYASADDFEKSLDILNIIINNDKLKNKLSYNFLTWLESIIISISEDISEFNMKDLIDIIQKFYNIIINDLSKNDIGLLILDNPYANFKFYFFIKQLITILENKNEKLKIIQLKNLRYMPTIILDINEIINDTYSVVHYSRMHTKNILYQPLNELLLNKNISYENIDIVLKIYNKLLNEINYYDINGSLYNYQIQISKIIKNIINENNNNNVKLLNFIYNNLFNLHEIKSFKTLNSDNIINIIKSKNNEELTNNKNITDIVNKLKTNNYYPKEQNITKNNLNDDEINNIEKILNGIYNKKTSELTEFYNFELDGKIITKNFFENPNINNLIQLIDILIEGLQSSLNIKLTFYQIYIFSQFMIYYINKNKTKKESLNSCLKGRIGQFYFEDKNIILAMLALSHCLNDKNVDIVTSSEYISNKVFEKYKKFYDLFNIKSDIIDSNFNENTQIIYGTLEQFENSILEEISSNDVNSNFNIKRERNIILFDEINEMININSYTKSKSYSNSFFDYNFWIYKPIYNLVVEKNIKNLEQVRNALIKYENGIYKSKVENIRDNLLLQLINAAIIASEKKINKDYVKILENESYRIYVLDEKTGKIQPNLIFAGFIHPFIQIKEGIIPSNFSHVICSITKTVYIDYYYQNIFCLGGIIDDERILQLYNLNSFDCLYDYDIKIDRIVSDNQYELIINKLKENTGNKNCKILILFKNYSEAKEFQNYLNNNCINNIFIYGEMNNENEKNISKFENDENILLSTYECLKGIKFNFISDEFLVIFAYKPKYLEEVYNTITKAVFSKEKNIKLNCLILNSNDLIELLYDVVNNNYMNKENEINNFKIIQDMLLYQKALYNFLNSNYIHNLVNLYFPGIKSYFSFISDSINYFKFKWCEFYSNSKNKNISINDFLYEIKLGDLLYFVNDFYKYIQDHILL